MEKRSISCVWEEEEDDVLIAAVLIYGEREKWDIIASFQPNKTAKQCKARWYENKTHERKFQQRPENWALELVLTRSTDDKCLPNCHEWFHDGDPCIYDTDQAQIKGGNENIVNMDEDEHEACSCERQVEEVTSFAALLKSRELEAAGSSVIERTKRKRITNFDEEIPFTKKPNSELPMLWRPF